MKTALLLSVVTIHALATGTSCKDADDSSLVQAAPLRSVRKVLPPSFGKINDTATSQSLLKQKPEPAEAASDKTAAKPAKEAATLPKAASDKIAAKPSTLAAAPPKTASDKTAAKPSKEAATPPKAASDKTAAKPAKEAATPPKAASDKTAAKPSKEAATPPKAASDKIAAKPAKEAATPPKAASDKTAAKPAKEAATPPKAASEKIEAKPSTLAGASPEAPSDKTAEQPAKEAATPPGAPSDKTAEQPAKEAATPPAAPSDKTAEQPAKEAATPPAAPSDKTAEQPANEAATPPAAPSDKTAEQPANEAATPTAAPSDKTAEQPANEAATPPAAPSDKTAEQLANEAATPPAAPSDKTAEQPANEAATPTAAPSDKTAEQPANEAATPTAAPSDKTAEQPANEAATPPAAPSDKTAEQPANEAATPTAAPSDKTAEQPANEAATPPAAPSDKTAEQPETGVAEGSNGAESGTGNMSVPAAKTSGKQTAQPLIPLLPSEPALDSSTRVVEIVVPNANNSHAVIRIRNPDAIDIEDVNVSNPVASLRSKTNLPLKALAIHRVPTTIYSKNDSFDGLRHLRLQVESFDTMNSSVEDYATVSKDALLEMIKALQRASPICHNLSQARVEQKDMLEQEEALMSKTDDLSKSLERVVQGSVAASGLEVAKAAQKILENRQSWEAHANQNLLLRQQAKKSMNQLAIELLGAVRHGITGLKTCAVASKVKVNLTQVREEFFAALDLGKGNLSVSRMNIELEDLEKAINVSANNLTLSISLSANLVQDAVLKANASKHLNSAVDVKENLTSLLYERVHLVENISHDTSRLPPLADRATLNLSMGTTALVISASQAEGLAKQLQVIDSSIQEMYQETLETDVHMKLKGLTLQKTLREALRTCALGLRLARLSGKEVNNSLAEIFRNFHGIYGNASSPIEFLRKPGELQSVTKLSTLHTNSSPHNASTPARLSERGQQWPEAEDSKEVPWNLPNDPKTADTTSLLFGVPRAPPVPPSKESRLLPNLLIASAMSLFLILGSVLLWIVSA